MSVTWAFCNIISWGNRWYIDEGYLPKRVNNLSRVDGGLDTAQDFFYQVGHQTMYAFMGNKHFFTKQCHCQTYQNYEQSRQKLGTFLENKVL